LGFFLAIFMLENQMAGKLSNHFFHEDMGGVLIGTPKKKTSEARGMLHRRCDSFSHLPEHSEFTIRGSRSGFFLEVGNDGSKCLETLLPPKTDMSVEKIPGRLRSFFEMVPFEGTC